VRSVLKVNADPARLFQKVARPEKGLHLTGSFDPRKEEALQRFVPKLLASKVGGSIARLLLFGSVAKGEAREGSDIDILVIATEAMEEVSRACAEAAFEVAVETGESIEPLVRCVDQARHPQSYFLYWTLHSGQEVYQMEAE
jgi:predicted nucleotidyltransferase